MRSYRRSRRRRDAETLLRQYRAEARNEFVRELSGRIDSSPVRRPTAWSRLAFAGAASSLILGMFAAVGGFGYVASGASATYSVAKQVVVKHKVSLTVDKSSAAAAYPNSTPQENVAGSTAQNSAGAVGGVATANTLPFTGISLLVAVIIGSALLALGLILRRRERRLN